MLLSASWLSKWARNFSLEQRSYTLKHTTKQYISLALFSLFIVSLQAQMIEDKDNDLVEDFADMDSDNDGIMDMDEGVECEIVDLDILFPMGSLNAIDDFNAALITVGGVNGALIQVDTTFTGGATLDEFEISNRHTGDESGLLLGVNSNDPSQTLSEIYTFSELVCDFSITVFDLDRSDAITVFGSNGGVPVPFTLTEVGACIGIIGTNQLNSTCNVQVEPGSGDIAAHSFILQFDGCIDEMNLTYFDQGPGNGGSFTFVPTPFPTCLGQDTDGDGIPDALDSDSDNDGIPDAIEACGEITLLLEDCSLDSNGDGIYQMENGVSKGILVELCAEAPVDTDMDGTPDFLDLDSDNDGCPDAIEACTNSNPNVNDGFTFDVPAAGVNECGVVLDVDGVSISCEMPPNNNYINEDIGCLQASLTFIQNITCFGDDDGSASVLASEGNVPYTYLWSPSGETTPLATMLQPGTNTVTVTDGCDEEVVLTIDILEPPILETTFTTIDVACNGDATGAIDLTIIGGTPGYDYMWNDGAISQDRNNIPAGNYSVTVTDMNDCEIIENFVITEPPALQLSGIIDDVACFSESTGSIDITVADGTPPYTFSWNDGITTEDRTSIPMGMYSVTVTDNNDCTIADSYVITEPALLQLSTTQVDILCNGDATGSIDVTVSGGTLPYNFAWNSGQTTEDINTLTAGTYMLSVTDANGCTVETEVTLTEPEELICSTTSDANAICSLPNGVGTVLAEGGVAPYQYSWDNGETTPTAVGLTSGLHMVTVIDANGCDVVCDVTIAETCNPCIEIIKSSSLDVGPDNIATPSDVISYTYEILNCGDVTITDISIGEDPVLFSGAGTLPLPVVPPNTDLDPAESITIQAQYDITLDDINAGFVDNQAIASSLDPDGNLVDDLSDTGNANDVNETGGEDDPTNTPIEEMPCIELTKSSLINLGIDGEVSAEDLVTYTYEIINCGNVTLNNITITEDASLFSGTGSTPVPDPLVATTLNPGESTTSSASYEITQADIDAGFINNQALTDAESPSGTPVSDLSDTQNPGDVNETGGPDDPTNTPLEQTPCIIATKGSLLDLGANGVANPGDIITYTYELTNCGNVTLSDVNLNEDANLFSGTGIIPAPSSPESILAPNESTTLTSTYGITQMDIDAGFIDNQAIATANEPNGSSIIDLSDTSNPEDINETGGPDDPTNTPIGETPCIEVVKESSLNVGADGISTPGDIITYSYTFLNCGNTTLSGITIVESTSSFSGTGNLPIPSTPSSTVLSPGEEATATATYSITQEDIDAGLVDNQALVSGISPAGSTTMDESDTGNENDINETGGPDDPTNTPIPQDPCIEVVKSSSLDLGIDAVSTLGDLISYEYVISNCGNVTLDNISILEETTLFSGTGELPIIAPLLSTTLSPGQSTTSTSTYAITQADIDAAFINNQAIVNGNPPFGGAISDQSDTGNADDVNETGGPDDPTNTPIPQLSCIELFKSSTFDAGIDATTTVGDVITYDYVIINCGTVTLNNISIVEDPILFSGSGNIPVPSPITVAALLPGEQTTSSATYVITQEDIDAGEVNNQAIVDSEDPFGEPVTDLSDTQNIGDINETGGPDDPTNTPLPNGACIVVTKGSVLDLGVDAIASPGDIVLYTYQLRNCGNVTLSNVTLTEDSNLFSGTGTIPTPSTPPAVLAPNESTTITSTYAITQMDIDAGFIDNQAIANATDPDGNNVEDLSDTSNSPDINETGGPDDPTNTPIGESPCIEILKESSLNVGADGISTPGDVITYSFTIINCGNVTLGEISLAESSDLFSGTGILPIPTSPSSTTLSPGEEATASATYAITQEDIDAGFVDNQTIVSGSSPSGTTTMDESDTGNNNDINETGGPDDPTNTPIPQEPCIAVVKSSSLDLGVDGVSTVGDIITYEYVIINCGNVTLNGIDLAEDVNLFTGTGNLPSITPLTTTILSPGQETTTTSTYVITQADINAGLIDNQALVSGTPPLGEAISDLSDTGNAGDINETGGLDDPTNTPIPQDPCIELLKSSTFEAGIDGTTSAGDIITYDYTIINCGTVTLDNITLSEDGSLFNGTGTLPLPSVLLITTLDPGETTTASATYEITQADIDAGAIDNQAIVESEDPFGAPINDLSDTQNDGDINETGGPDDPTNTPLEQIPCIALTKGSLLDLGANGVADPEDIVTYTYELTNCGNVTLSNVALTEDDVLFTGTGMLPVPSVPPSILAPGASATLTSTYAITQMDIDAGFINNQAITTSTDPNGNGVNDLSDTSNPEDANETGGPDDPTNTPIGETPCIKILKESSLDTGADGISTPGDIITFSYTIINCGNTTLSGITLTESSDLFSGTGMLPTPTVPSATTLSPGQEATASATYAITQEDIDAGLVDNQALVAGTSPTGSTSMDESDTANEKDINETGGPDDPTNTPIPQEPCIEILKSSSLDLAADGQATVGDVITYEYVILNCGNVTLEDIDLSEEATLFTGTGSLPTISPLTVTTLSPGQQTNTMATYIITQADIDAAGIDNQAIAIGTPPFGSPVSDLSDTANPLDINETGGPDDATNTPIPQDPCIELLKSSTFDAGPDGTTTAGDIITYDYIIINCGTVTLSNVTISEEVGIFTGSGNLPVPTAPVATTLAPGESTTSSATYIVTQEDIDAGSVDNQAFAESVDPFGEPVTDFSDTQNPGDTNETGGPDDATNTPFPTGACIVVTKGSVFNTGADGISNPGDIITYSYEITNCGTVTLSNIALIEDAGLFTGTGTLPVPFSPPAVLAPGESVTVSSTYAITQMDIDAGFIDNQAIASSIDPEGNDVIDLSDTSNSGDVNETGGPDDPTNTPIGNQDCIEVLKGSSLDLGPDNQASVGDIVTYNYELINCGNTTLTDISLVEIDALFSGTGLLPVPSTPIPQTLAPGAMATSLATYILTQADIDAGGVNNQVLGSGTGPSGGEVSDQSDTTNPNDPNETGGPDDPTFTGIPQVPCLELIKSSSFDLGSDNTTNAGDIIFYIYTFRNCGNVTVNNLSLEETLSSFSGTGGLPVIEDLVLTSLSPGQESQTIGTYQVTQEDIDAGFVDNQALITGNAPLGEPVEDISDTGNVNDINETGGPDDATNTPLEENPCIEVTKGSTLDVGGDGIVSPGDIVTYSYVVTNCGNVTLSNIDLTEDSDLFTGTGALPLPLPAMPSILAPGESATSTSTYSITQQDIDSGSVNNQAIAMAIDPMGNPITDLSDTSNELDINETDGSDDPTNTPLEEAPCISIIKSSNLDLGDDSIANPGDQITYTYVITNCGNITLENITVVEDDLFSGDGPLPFIPPVVPSTLAPGENATVSAIYTINQTDINVGFITNQAIATGTDPSGDLVEDLSDTGNELDPTETGGPDDATFTGIPQDNCINLLKSSVLLVDDSSLPATGDIIEYMFEVTNCGNVTLTDLTLEELDAVFTGTGNNFIIDPLPVLELNPNESFTIGATYEITQTDIDAGSIDNQALITSVNPLGTEVSDLSDTANSNDINETGGPDDATNTPLPNIDCVELIKSSVFLLGTNQESNPGDTIIYTYEYSNCGNTTLLNLEINEDDILFTGSGNLPTIDLGVTTLLPGESASVEAIYIITQADVDATSINNQAIISGVTPNGSTVEDLSDTGNPNDPNETGGPDDATNTEIGINPCIELLKGSEFMSTVGAQGIITYLYTIQNCGNVTLSNIELIEREEFFTGTNGIPVIIPSSITTLAVGESTTATAQYQISIDDVIAEFVNNQAFVTAVDPTGQVVEDLSDTTNPNDPNETGGPDDATFTEIDIVSSVSGTVFEDIDGNSVEDIPLEGIIVTVIDQGGIVQVDTTDADGNYMFEDVIPGPITIIETDPEGFNSVGDTDGENDNTIVVFIQPSDINTDNDFIDEEPGIILGNVFEDEGADLTADVPLENVLVTLIDRDGDEFTTLTDSLGNYMFVDVDPGPFTLIETDPEDFSSVADVDGDDPNVINNMLFSGEEVPDQDFLDAQCDELVCNADLQISLNVDCELVLDPDDLLEAPIPGDYTIELFNEHGDFIRNDTLTAEEAGETIQYQISCLDNSCWGNIIVEANIIPEIFSPCACTEDGSIPSECNLWCTPENTFPGGIISPEEAASRFGFCGPNLLGDISIEETRTGDMCAEGGEIIEITYTGKVILHGQISEVDILCQRYSVFPISLDSTSFSLPDDINLDCNYLDAIDLSDEELGSPLSIYKSTNSIISAYPHYINSHDSIPLVEISYDTIQIEVGQVPRDTMVKEFINGGEIWVLKTIVDKVYEEEISEVRDTIGMTPELIPVQDRVCNILSSFSDIPFEACGNGIKIIRTWELIDWCNSEISLDGRQTIEIEDLTPPTIVELVDGELVERTTFDDVIVSIEAYRCEASVALPRLLTSDNCDSSPTVIWQTEEGTVGNNFITGLWLSDAPIAVTAIVTDECGNETSATFNYYVIDDVPPVVSCETSLQISLTSSASNGFGYATISAYDLDEGSHDSGCGKVTLSAIRAEDWRTPVYNCNSTIAGFESISCSGNTIDVDLGSKDGKESCTFDESTIGSISSPGETVRFCCEDLGKIIPVILFVEDENGNINQCLVNVEIVDNSKALIQCQDLTVNCSDGDALLNPPLAGRVCESERTYRVELLRESRENDACLGGSVIREWYIDVDGNNTYETNEPYCKQVVTVSSEDSFNPYSIKWPKHFDGQSIAGINIEYVNEEIVEVPSSVHMGDALECTPSDDLEESNQFVPIWCDTDCGLVGISAETDTITAGDACLKLIKKWTIIDWCTYNSNQESIDDENDTSADTYEAIEDWAQFEHTSTCQSYSGMIDDPVYFRYVDVDVDGYYTFDQVISVVDNQAPEIMAEDIIRVNTSGGATTKDDGTVCIGEVNVTASAIDFCNSTLTSTTQLRWQITVFNGGQLLFRENAIGSEAIVASLVGESSDEIVINWQVSDGCGNSASSRTIVEFIDQQAPTPFCVPGISTVFMRSDGTVSFWAKDFDFGSFDNCTQSDNLRFTIVQRGLAPAVPDDEAFTEQSNITVHCSEINGLGQFDIWVWDNHGNGDFCSVDVLISDPGNQCDREAQGNISGVVSTSYGMAVANVDVVLSSNEQSEFPKQATTDTQGQYAFNNNPTGYNYEIEAHKTDDYSNGLTTLDVFLISQHILNAAPIQDSYKIIAADANGDSSITASDLNVLRRLILGLDRELANQSSWKFVPSDFTFFDKNNPWPFIQSIQIRAFNEPSNDNDFIAVKIGDVNESYNQTESRSSEQVTLEVTDANVEAGQLVHVPIYSTAQLIGFQFTLELDGLAYHDVIPGAIPINDYNIGTHEEALSLSWNLTDDNLKIDNTELFTLVFKASEKTTLSKALTLSSSITSAEAYSSEINPIHSLVLSISSKDQYLFVHQNSPNPFSEFTKIKFELEKSANVSLSIFNLAGQTILETEDFYSDGVNFITINSEDLSNARGILYYRLKIDGESYINRMISLE